MNLSEAPARLKKWREKRGLQQCQAAKLLGVANSTYWKWESGKAEPRLAWLLLIAKRTKGAVPLLSWSPVSGAKPSSDEAA